MGKIIAIANQKGGVGKTTTAVNLSAALAEAGKKVLMTDLDPQGNTTSGLGCRVNERNSVYDAMMGRTPLAECIQKTEIKKLRLIGADIRLAGAEVELVSVNDREFYLKRLLNAVQMATGWTGQSVESISLSYGMATTRDNPNIEAALKAADHNMYEFKRRYYTTSGRERRRR